MLHNIKGKTRFRRGLFNFVGDISKTLFGTNTLIKQLVLQDKIITLETFISEMSEDISIALNAISQDKHGTLETTIVP